MIIDILVIILAVILTAVFIYTMFKRRKGGCSGCSGCSGCNGCPNSLKKDDCERCDKQ